MRFSASSLFITLCISFLLILLLNILLSYKKSYKLFRTDFIEYIKIDRDKSTFKSHRDFDSEIEMTFKHF